MKRKKIEAVALVILLCIEGYLSFAMAYSFPNIDSFLVFKIKMFYIMYISPVVTLATAYLMASLLLPSTGRSVTKGKKIVLVATIGLVALMMLFYANLGSISLLRDFPGSYTYIEASRKVIYFWAPVASGICLASMR